jgi:hypothetical protein
VRQFTTMAVEEKEEQRSLVNRIIHRIRSL